MLAFAFTMGVIAGVAIVLVLACVVSSWLWSGLLGAVFGDRP